MSSPSTQHYDVESYNLQLLALLCDERVPIDTASDCGPTELTCVDGQLWMALECLLRGLNRPVSDGVSGMPWQAMFEECFEGRDLPTYFGSPSFLEARKKLQIKGILPMSLNSHDRCCWTCHLPIATIECQRCTRCHLSFHSKCALEQNVFNTRPHVVAGLDEDEKRVIIPLTFNTSDSTICSECKHREADIAFNTNFGFLKPTRENVHKSGIELFTCAVATLIKSCEKLTETFEHIDYDDKPKCAKYFHSKAKLDLCKMKEKALNGRYRSTEEFMFDIKLIIHNQKVGNFYEQSIKVEDALEIEKNCDELERLARNEMDYLEMCDGCYWNYFGYYTPKEAALKKTAPQKATSQSAILETDGNYHFTQPCGNPHGLIWTRMNEVKDAVVYQPAKVYGYRRPGTYELSQKKVWVIPFGYTTLGPKPAKVKNCWLYSKQPPPGSLRKKVLKIKYQKEFRRLHGFKKLAKAFIKNCRDNKGKVYRFVTDYHPPENASRFKLDHLYMDVTFVEKLNKELPLEVNHNDQYRM